MHHSDSQPRKQNKIWFKSKDMPNATIKRFKVTKPSHASIIFTHQLVQVAVVVVKLQTSQLSHFL